MTEDELQREAEFADAAYKDRARINKKALEILKQQIAEQEKASPSVGVLLRMNPQDVELAKTIAERKGLPYQTFLKSIIHEGLERERG